MAVTPFNQQCPKTSYYTRKLPVSMFYRTGVTADRSFTLREQEFSTFLLVWPWP